MTPDANAVARLALAWRLLIALASGVLLALAFPPVGASLLAPPAVALLVVATYGTTWPRGALLGFAQGAVSFGILLRWLSVVGGDAWILLVGLCAAWMAVVGAGLALVTRLRWWPLWVGCVWVLQEALRDRIPLGGFPWGRLAFAQTATTLTPWASVGGAPLVTFATALAGAVIAYVVIIVVSRRPQARTWAAAGIAGLLAIGLSGLVLPRPTSGQDGGGPAEVTAAVVQGGVVSTGLPVEDERRVVLDRHVGATLQLAADVDAGRVPAPDLVIWPENAVDIDPYRDAEVASAVTAAARAVQAPILIGAIIDAPGNPAMIANAGVVWTPDDGPGEMYLKRRPVPFGEYIPFRELIAPLVGRLDRIPRDMAPGDVPGVLQVGPARVGDVICFEVAYDDVVREAVTAGGRVIVVQTNNATFAGLGQPDQQVAMSRLRAVEHGRAVLVAATSGISAVVSPDGSVLAEMLEGESGYVVRTVPLRDSLTVADRLGPLPEWILALAAVGAMAWAGWSSRRARRAAGGQVTADRGSAEP